MWGMTEQQGWREPTNKNLTDLGEIAEGRYRLAIDNTDLGQREQVVSIPQTYPDLSQLLSNDHNVCKPRTQSPPSSQPRPLDPQKTAFEPRQ